MKWYHYLILTSAAMLALGVEQRVLVGEADLLIVLASIPATIYLNTKVFEFVSRSPI